VSALDIALFASAMVVGLFSGIYAGLGLNTETPLDRKAEVWFAAVMWVVAFGGYQLGGNVGTGMVLGTLVMVILWSVLHFPAVKTLEAPMPHLTPLIILIGCAVMLILLGVAILID
jgi:hypothetical protein